MGGEDERTDYSVRLYSFGRASFCEGPGEQDAAADGGGPGTHPRGAVRAWLKWGRLVVRGV
jgi:hypothetical protein